MRSPCSRRAGFEPTHAAFVDLMGLDEASELNS